MKVFRKMFAFAVTVSAIALATSAFAATAEYDSSNVLVKVADTSSLTEENQMTVAVVPKNFGETDEEIYFIDQDEAATIKANLARGLAVKDALQNPANFEVRVAGTTMDMKTFAIPAVADDDEYEYIGGTDGKPLGIKGTFQYNGTAKTVVLTLKDASNDKTGSLSWDLLENIPGANGLTITFGLEIHPSVEGQDLSQITIESIE